MLTEEEKKAQEAQFAVLLKDLIDPNEGFKSVKAKITELVKRADELKSLDPMAIAKTLEQMRATQEAFSKMVRSSKRGLYVPGIEDEKFSMLKALLAIRHGGNYNEKSWKEFGAEHEKGILDAVRAKMASMDVYGKAAQSIGDDKLGGYFIPDQVIPDVIGAIYTRSVFINLVGEGQQRISVLEGLVGGNIKVPKFDGGLIAYWIGDQDTYAESQTNLGDVTMNPKKLGILVRITDSMKRLAGYGFENLLRRDFERAAAKKLDYAIYAGKGGDNQPRGLLNTKGIKFYSVLAAQTGGASLASGLAYVTDPANASQLNGGLGNWAPAECGFDDLDNMQLALEEDDIVLDDSFCQVSSPRYWKRLKQNKTTFFNGQTSGGAYVLGLPMIPDDRLKGVIGDFAWSTQIPTTQKAGASIGVTGQNAAAKCTDLVMGNLDSVVMGRWAGIEIEDDAGKGQGFTSDTTYMKLRMYVDVAVRQVREILVATDVQARS